MNPHHFLVGCLRSGTTLLMRIVGAHPQITVVDETQWLPQWYEKRIGLTTDSCVTPELTARLARHTRFDRLGSATVLRSPSASYAKDYTLSTTRTPAGWAPP